MARRKCLWLKLLTDLGAKTAQEGSKMLKSESHKNFPMMMEYHVASDSAMVLKNMSTSKLKIWEKRTVFIIPLFRYYCPKGAIGQYIYVGKFRGNNDYLHLSHISAFRYESGLFYC